MNVKLKFHSASEEPNELEPNEKKKVLKAYADLEVDEKMSFRHPTEQGTRGEAEVPQKRSAPS